MFFRRRAPEAVRLGETVAWLLMVSLRCLSVAVICIMIVGLLLNFSSHLFMTQFLPSIILLIALNLGFAGMHGFFRSLRLAYEAEADERLRNVRPLVHMSSDRHLD